MLDQGSQALGALLDHRCDGNRNILHAAVSVCFPVSNKETKEEEGELAIKAPIPIHLICYSSSTIENIELLLEYCDVNGSEIWFTISPLTSGTFVRLFFMPSVHISFQKLRGLRETHLQSACQLWRP